MTAQTAQEAARVDLDAVLEGRQKQQLPGHGTSGALASPQHLCAQTGASRAFRACVGQADAQGASCQAATRPLSLESLWSEQKELKVKGLESLWSEKKELKVKCGWPAAGLRQSNICGWPAAGLRQSNMLEKLHKTQSPRRFQHTLYCTRTHTHTAPHTHPASPKQAAAYTHRIQIQYGRQGNSKVIAGTLELSTLRLL